jgi:predicted nuclease of predicted toxin-antitoxin system
VTSFLVDEDLPRTLAPSLREAGFFAEDVRDVGLGGRSDSEIIRCAKDERRILVTRDVALASLDRVPSRSRYGIVRFRQAISTKDLNSAIVAALNRLEPAQFRGSITVIEPGRVRIRRGRR